jgi:hypothetical protein
MIAVPMSLENSRKVCILVAGGNPSAQRDFEDTIQGKSTLEEVRRFLSVREIENLEKIYNASCVLRYAKICITYVWTKSRLPNRA